MTKVTILGEQPQETKKPIEFVAEITSEISLVDIVSTQHPKNWENITLIQRKFSNGLDLMFAYDEKRKYRALFLGHFNDGIVE